MFMLYPRNTWSAISGWPEPAMIRDRIKTIATRLIFTFRVKLARNFEGKKPTYVNVVMKNQSVRGLSVEASTGLYRFVLKHNSYHIFYIDSSIAIDIAATLRSSCGKSCFHIDVFTEVTN